jgi:hypothetical protein
MPGGTAHRPPHNSFSTAIGRSRARFPVAIAGATDTAVSSPGPLVPSRLLFLVELTLKEDVE